MCSEFLDKFVVRCKAFCCCPQYLFSVARPTITSAAFPFTETLHVSAPPEPKTVCICFVAISNYLHVQNTFSVFVSIYMQRVLGHSCFPVQSVLLLSSLSVYPGTPNNYFCSCSVDRNSSCVRALRTENCLYMLGSHLELFAHAKHTFCLHVYLHAASLFFH